MRWQKQLVLNGLVDCRAAKRNKNREFSLDGFWRTK